MTNYVYHDVTALCERENEEITVPVRFAVTQMSGTPYPGIKSMGPDCATLCMRFKQNDCSVMKKSRGIKSIE